MNDETPKGGRGECPFCHEWHNNVSYHSAWECKKNPDCALPQSAFAGAGASLWPADTHGNPQTPNPDHECQYDSDGGSCNKCGKTVTENLMNFKSPGVSVYDGGNPKPTTRPAGLDFKCNSCGRQLIEPGAILFSPPKETAGGETIMCNKYHLCQECFELICDVTNLKY
jgi:hypothetical protein